MTGDHPILTPKSSLFTGKLVEKAHHGNLHRRFGLKMTKKIAVLDSEITTVGK